MRCGGEKQIWSAYLTGNKQEKRKGALEGGNWAEARESGDGTLRRLRRHRWRWHSAEVPLALRLLVHQVPYLRHRHYRATTLSRSPHHHHQAPPSIHLPPLSVSRYSQAWPRAAAADTSNSSPAASSLVDGDLSRITDYIYLGGDAAARDRNLLHRHASPTYSTAPVLLPRAIHRGFPLQDALASRPAGEDISSLLYDVFDFIEEARAAFRGRGRTLVHCVSRDLPLRRPRCGIPNVAPCPLVRRRPQPRSGLPRRGRPQPWIRAQLLQRQRLLLASPPPTLWPDIPRRVYRMAPHSAYDPLHLVPKTVDRPGRRSWTRGGLPGARVERGQWCSIPVVGTECERTMVESAAAAAQQVLRYERAMGRSLSSTRGRASRFLGCLGCDLSAVARRGWKRTISISKFTEGSQGCANGGGGPDAVAGIGRTIPAVDPESGEDSDAAVPFGSPSTFSGVGDNIGDTVMDWAFSPYRVGREEDDAVAMSIHKETTSELHQAVEAEGATLYHWQPLSETVNIVHPAVLDSESVFLLLIPARGMGTHGAKRVYVWVGRRLFFLLKSPCMRHHLVMSGLPMPSQLKPESMAMSSDAWSHSSLWVYFSPTCDCIILVLSCVK
ncbi:unnamed protein product [Spirodela intermedia]|uniref:Protein-tyrosine-phosphatase MKP1 C-terminal domain-containing protein n=1 Tax=Spirodela intermedia TaxID=51605 RepID=A0A7I8J4L5_SPIIN|nr:unnamed protein product [Spirodela intermedia]CAA6664994.1 unnamed protein product [Spirodela intermedia]